MAHELDVAMTILRVCLGVVFLAHGWNHGWGGGGLAGTTRWFAGLGLRPARLHALTSVGVELVAGAALVAGLLVPVAAAAAIGVMTVAFVTVHRKNGFFVFAEGYEYVVTLAVALTALAIVGPGRWSLDHQWGVEPFGEPFHGIVIGLAAAAAGIAGALAMLAACWRPGSVESGS